MAEHALLTFVTSILAGLVLTWCSSCLPSIKSHAAVQTGSFGLLAVHDSTALSRGDGSIANIPATGPTSANGLLVPKPESSLANPATEGQSVPKLAGQPAAQAPMNSEPEPESARPPAVPVEKAELVPKPAHQPSVPVEKAEPVPKPASPPPVPATSPPASSTGDSSPSIPAVSPPAASVVASGNKGGKKPYIERVWLVSHRSCSEDQNTKCNKNFVREEQKAKECGLKAGINPDQIFVHTALPDYLLNDPKWGERYTKPGIRGRGYWFWKSAIMDHVLSDAVPDGDWVVYADGDRHWLMNPLINDAREKDSKGEPDLIVQRQREVENGWTRGDVFGRFGVEPTNGHYGESSQYKAQVFMVRVNPKTRQFLKFWVSLSADHHLISGEESVVVKDYKGFRHSREDQSLYSMLLKAQQEGGCKDVTFQGKTQSSKKDGACIHPEFGIPGLTIVQHSFR